MIGGGADARAAGHFPGEIEFVSVAGFRVKRWVGERGETIVIPEHVIAAGIAETAAEEQLEIGFRRGLVNHRGARRYRTALQPGPVQPDSQVQVPVLAPRPLLLGKNARVTVEPVDPQRSEE